MKAIEYANQGWISGVMRFLQTEWHRHERDRNAWEIERAEMKSRIGKLEGDVRTNKRLHESLGKHVRLLEAALKKEREKVRKLTNNEAVEDLRDPKEIARESINALKCTCFLRTKCFQPLSNYLLLFSSTTETVNRPGRLRPYRRKSTRISTGD
jgi:chromosome segregation ATPase